jgi:hypothetical protein
MDGPVIFTHETPSKRCHWIVLAGPPAAIVNEALAPSHTVALTGLVDVADA